ncbi:hypothetical protein BABAYKA_00020 [Brevundimonas phage vB_BpoS-Babayka]|uniref:Uncharacterized protein n=1 Tax=Brevundimonas phage vB_BpoS-Babayka TaxID=2948596 RepID=A0A9E7MVF2_9CAUD|nr:hypothetical protein BABAYKA_00020 [Brevundimonas phage vB_BpoS-Babayka]
MFLRLRHLREAVGEVFQPGLGLAQIIDRDLLGLELASVPATLKGDKVPRQTVLSYAGIYHVLLVEVSVVADVGRDLLLRIDLLPIVIDNGDASLILHVPAEDQRGLLHPARPLEVEGQVARKEGVEFHR